MYPPNDVSSKLIFQRRRWAKPYRTNAAIRGIFTNNGVEALNGVLKNRVMGGATGKKSIPQLFEALVLDYLPTKLHMYRQQVIRRSCCDNINLKWPTNGCQSGCEFF